MDGYLSDLLESQENAAAMCAQATAAVLGGSLSHGHYLDTTATNFPSELILAPNSSTRANGSG